MTPMVDDAKEEVQHLIFSHLKGLRAGDTLLGIVERVARDRIDRAARDVEVTLGRLVREGAVVRLSPPGCTARFVLAEDVHTGETPVPFHDAV